MTNPTAKTSDRHEAATYEIHLQGHLDARWAVQLGVPALEHDNDGTTIMRGIEADQAALHGLLQRIRDLGLALISVRRIEPVTDTRTGV